MNRLFTFGCSFTSYNWPTWADILAQEYDQYQNWGRPGAGNHFIFYSLVEAIKRYRITHNDTVMIMWTSVGREDRYIKGKWATPGSIWHSDYTQDYIEKYADPTGYLLTNVTIIDAAKSLLDNIGCQYKMFKVIPFTAIDDSPFKITFKLDQEEKEIRNLYQDTFNVIRPSVHKIIFNNNWNSRNHIYLKGIEQKTINDLKISYNNCSGPDWPTFQEFLTGRDIEPGYEFLINVRNKLKNKQRIDAHPTPLEHAEYLEKVGITLSSKQKEYAANWDNNLLTNIDFDFISTGRPKRF